MFVVSLPKILPAFLCLAASICLSPIDSEAQTASPRETTKFSLAVAAKVIKDDTPQIIPLSDNMVLQSGNCIKFYLEFEKEGFLYLFHTDPQGRLLLLFPGGSQAAKIKKHTAACIPGGNNWLELDSNTGKETFHLLVSAVRLEQLEGLYATHRMLKEDNAIRHSARSILAKIEEVRGEKLTSRAERPLRMAGKLRGNPGSDQSIPQAIANSAREITTSGTYVKTITIDHR